MSEPKSQLSKQEADALTHWAHYGQRSTDAPKTRITASDWKTKPFAQPDSTSWDVRVQAEDISKLMLGFKPTAMEEKWFVYADEPRGNSFSLHLHRSWTGYQIVELTIEVDLDENGATQGGKIVRITWETEEEIFRGPSERVAKETAVSTCRYYLDVNLSA